MEKNKFKMRISNMFQSSYSSCCSKNTNIDVLEKPPKLQHYQLIHLFSPRQICHPFPSLCKPKNFPEISQTKENYKHNKEFPPRSKITEYQHLLHPPESYIDRLKCPPVSPRNSFESETKNKPKRNKHAKTRKSRSRSRTLDILDFQGVKYNGLFSSDEESEDEDKTTPFFSSRSLSSVSSESYRRNNYRKTLKCRKRVPKNGGGNKKEAEEKGALNLRGSVAVVKRSNDPYNDFKSSMVEMIVENNILSVEDLENMLQWFLLLNTNHHHRIIVEVFTDIWKALFSNIY